MLEKTEYGNGDSRRYSYNNFGQKIVDYVTDNGTQTKAYSWAYNDSGISTRHTDYINRLQYLFDYDSLGRLSKEEVKDYDTGSFVGYTEYGYDVRNNLTKLITNFGGKANTQRYYYSTVEENENSANYRKDNLPTKYKLYSSRYAIYDYDGINRLNQRKFTLDNTALYYNYIYKLSDRNAENEKTYKTTQIAEEYIGNDVYIYDYDVLGNITSIRTAERKSTVETEADFKEYINDVDYVTYTYDDLGQLTEENFPNKKAKNTWTYDELGNIAKRVNQTTRTITNPVTNITHEDEKKVVVRFGYTVDPDSDGDEKSEASWNNLLTSVVTTKYLDDVFISTETKYIDYDAIGNPISYLGASLSWNGRQLTSYTTADKSISYKYDSNGLRTSKTFNGVTSKYFYVNGQLHYEERSDGTKLYFYYDSNGYLTGIEYNGNNLYTATNRRGDVLAIYKNTGECIARYEYDAWGNVISVIDCDYYDATQEKIVEKDITNDLNSTDIAMVNPIRYRGYYYDTETKFYYLQSRYYNPEVGRFLNADGYISTDIDEPLTYNMFAYCGNNPVNYCDPTGCSADEYSGPLDVMFTLLEFTIDLMADVLESSISSANAGASAKYISAQVASLGKFSDGVEVVGKVFAYGFVGLESLTNVYENYLNGEPSSEIMWDLIVDVSVLGGSVYLSGLAGSLATTACTKLGAFVGSFAAPGVGTVVGATVGIFVGFGLDWVTSRYIIPFLKDVEE